MCTPKRMDHIHNHHPKSSLWEFSRSQLAARMESWGQPAYRADQVWQWVWQKGCRDFSEMTNVSKELRHNLDQSFNLELPRLATLVQSRDATLKGLLQLDDGNQVEWVLIPDKDHFTLCLSTQVGCALGCSFCSTGQMGLERNLTPGEILAQVLTAREVLARSQSPWPLRNIVFMGMGEPLLNWAQVEKSLHILRDPLAFGFSHRRVTVSTVGVPGFLESFARSRLASLAVSLHAPTQELRQEIMPKAADMFPLPKLIDRLRSLPLKPRQRITIEYILLGGINDGLDQAKELNRLLSRLKCKINLISFNPAPGLSYAQPDAQRVLEFERFLWAKGQTVILRKSKGQDIQAACGQLRSSIPNPDAKTLAQQPETRSDHAQTRF
ncbi:MAG: 23S rRNA (adenine(2503)-C(2))-methyltransferase RlmN [Desulfovermiculus sp.]|nr:23S rRNA (adenine(2503)-C(2))-methyltransferase RlmN [Desulfovermiculus sp.]